MTSQKRNKYQQTPSLYLPDSSITIAHAFRVVLDEVYPSFLKRILFTHQSLL
ncbi:Uncharacterised protein [Bartonella vinsonii]|uniref:Uncharacterized protein n=1 Tax=Bartonella vinsonii TaxID=33047 RepID=A0A3S5C031_BARVI|nr:Uncharacterised protein [Bartonella vinsonii]